MTTIIPSGSSDRAPRLDAPSLAGAAMPLQIPPAPVVPDAPTTVTTETAGTTANRSANAAGFAGASMLRSVHAGSGAIDRVEGAFLRLTQHGGTAFDAALHQPDVDTVLASIVDPAALFPRAGALAHSPAAEVRARFSHRKHGDYSYFNLLVTLTHGSDLARATVIADKLLDELPSARSQVTSSLFSPYWDNCPDSDIGGMTVGVNVPRVLPALIEVATRLGTDAPFSKRLLAFCDRDPSARSEVIGYFAAGIAKTPPMIRSFASGMSSEPHPNDIGREPTTARIVFAHHLTGKKPTEADMVRDLGAMHWSEIPRAVETLGRDFGLPFSSKLAMTLATTMLATHDFTENQYLQRIGVLGAIADRAERDGEVGARAKLVDYIARTYGSAQGTDKTSVRCRVLNLIVDSQLSTLTLDAVDGAIGAHFSARADRARQPAKGSEIFDPLTYLAKQIELGSRTYGADGQPSRVLARAIQVVLAKHGFGGPDGFGRYLATHHREATRAAGQLAGSDGSLSMLLTVVGSPCSLYRSDRGFTSTRGDDVSFQRAFNTTAAACIARERTLAYRAKSTWDRLVSWFSK